MSSTRKRIFITATLVTTWMGFAFILGLLDLGVDIRSLKAIPNHVSGGWLLDFVRIDLGNFHATTVEMLYAAMLSIWWHVTRERAQWRWAYYVIATVIILLLALNIYQLGWDAGWLARSPKWSRLLWYGWLEMGTAVAALSVGVAHPPLPSGPEAKEALLRMLLRDLRIVGVFAILVAIAAAIETWRIAVERSVL